MHTLGGVCKGFRRSEATLVSELNSLAPACTWSVREGKTNHMLHATVEQVFEASLGTHPYKKGAVKAPVL